MVNETGAFVAVKPDLPQQWECRKTSKWRILPTFLDLGYFTTTNGQCMQHTW
jgi:hypothetical protein